MIHKVISTSAIINQFNIAVLEHLCETFREKHPDIVGWVNPQGNQNGPSTHTSYRFLMVTLSRVSRPCNVKVHLFKNACALKSQPRGFG
jgi:hypothetical protein